MIWVKLCGEQNEEKVSELNWGGGGGGGGDNKNLWNIKQMHVHRGIFHSLSIYPTRMTQKPHIPPLHWQSRNTVLLKLHFHWTACCKKNSGIFTAP